jgi:hypothetical protein
MSLGDSDFLSLLALVEMELGEALWYTCANKTLYVR